MFASKHWFRFGKDSVVKQTLYRPDFKFVNDQFVPSISSGVWLKSEGPPVTAIVNFKSPLIATFNVPSSELLQVSSVYSIVRVSLGIGLGSQTSPMSSPSKSSWFGFAVLGQLSRSFLIPSLS
jgi:hypothetical protein